MSASVSMGGLAPPATQRGILCEWRAPHVIFGTFLVVTLPMFGLVHFGGQAAVPVLIASVYACVLGLTHFFATFVVYLSSGNLKYFASTWKNRLVYFAIPALIFIYSGVRLTCSFPPGTALMVGFTLVGLLVRFADFNHFSRQSFGVLQICKAHSRVRYSPRTRNLENCLFFCLVALQGTTHVLGGGKVAAEVFWVRLGLGVAGGLFVAVSADHLWQLRRSRAGAVGLAPLGYFLIQSIAIFVTVIDLSFYAAALAVHYVEYHLLILLRSRKTEAEAGSRLDALRRWLVQSPARLGAFLLAVAGAVALTAHGAFGLGQLLARSPLPLRFTFYMLDGVYLFHYFVESFIWKFSQPYYRRTLSFLAPAKAAAMGVRS